jgi:hypothetical protein
MSLLDKLKAEAKTLKENAEKRQGGEFVKVNWFAPEVGDNIVRILPNTKNPDELFFKQVNIHYIKVAKKEGGVANVPVRCLHDYGEQCPLCVAYKELIVNESTKDKAREFRPIERYLYNVIDYKKKDVFPYAAPLSVHQGIMEWIEELETNIADPEVGHDFKVIKEFDPKKGKQFGTSYKVRPSLKHSAIPAKLAPLIENAVDLDTLYADKRGEDMAKYLKANGVSATYEETPDVDEPAGFADEPAGFAGDTGTKTESVSAPVSAPSDDDLEEELKALGV